jgi:hypothetical protein
MAGFVTRLIRAAQLEVALYEEVEADPHALGQATAVVVLSSLAAGIGSQGVAALGEMLLMTLAALLGWYVWAYLTYFIGTRWLAGLRTEADWGQLLRTIGFASAPGLVQVLGVLLPEGGGKDVLFLAIALWMLVAMVIAVRQALDYDSTPRAVGVCAIGWVIQLVISGVVFGLLGVPPPAPVSS